MTNKTRMGLFYDTKTQPQGERVYIGHHCPDCGREVDKGQRCPECGKIAQPQYEWLDFSKREVGR